MELVVRRLELTSESAIGALSAEGEHVCFTLEDRVSAGEKVFGRTAIPAGRYEVTIDMSARFKRLMPHILAVPGFEGVRIHKGNTAADTEGCLLVGLVKETDRISNCAPAFDKVFSLIKAGLADGKVYLTIA